MGNCRKEDFFMYELECLFPVHLREEVRRQLKTEGVEEIRIRIGQPPEFVNSAGSILCSPVYRITERDVSQMLSFISSYSLYAYQDKLRQGYLTIRGGHRVGVAGTVALDNGRITGIHHISFFNIRIAHEKKGCAEELLPYIRRENGIFNTLIFSEPGAGKTTVLRDCIRLISQGTEHLPGQKVCVVDERSEIAACHLGIPQNDLGPRTDVLDGCPKREGMRMLLRSMSPQVLAVDELGGKEDYRMVEEAVYSGSRVLGTVHMGDIGELSDKPYLSQWMKRKVFRRFVSIVRGKDGTRSYRIYDENREQIC